MEIILAQSCRLIGGVEMFCSLGNAAMMQCHSFHHPPVICFNELICILIGPGTFQLLSPLSYPQLVAGAIPSTSFDWSAVVARSTCRYETQSDVLMYICIVTIPLVSLLVTLYCTSTILMVFTANLTLQSDMDDVTDIPRLWIMVAHIYHRFKVLSASYAAPSPSLAALLFYFRYG